MIGTRMMRGLVSSEIRRTRAIIAPESHLKAVEFACTNKSGRSRQKPAVAEMYHSAESSSGRVLYRAALKSEMLALLCISVQSMLFAFATCASCSEHQDVETADVRQDVTQTTGSRPFFCHVQQSDMSLLRAQNSGFSDQNLGIQGG